MRQALIGYGLTAGIFLAIDIVWLTMVARHIYQEEIGALLRNPFLPIPAIAFYLIYMVGVLVFAVLPGVNGGGWTEALWRGALFGFCAYATYDLTNLATLQGYTVRIALIDLAWGTVLTATASALGTIATRALA